MQPSRRLTSRCSSPSSRERSSGEKESGSSTACGRRHGCSRREHAKHRGTRAPGDAGRHAHVCPGGTPTHAGGRWENTRGAHPYTRAGSDTRARRPTRSVRCTPSPARAQTQGCVCVHTHRAHKRAAAHACERQARVCVDSTQTQQCATYPPPPACVNTRPPRAGTRLACHSAHTCVGTGMNTRCGHCPPLGPPPPPPPLPARPPRPVPSTRWGAQQHRGARAPSTPAPGEGWGAPQLTMVRVIRSISCLSFVLCCRKGLCLRPRGQRGTQ